MLLHRIVQKTFPIIHDSRIALLIAHPHDQSTFFSPTLLALSEPSLNNYMKVVCVCQGRYLCSAFILPQTQLLGIILINRVGEIQRILDAEGETELFTGGGNILNVPNIAISDDGNLPDSMTVPWDPTFVFSRLSNDLAPPGNETLSDDPCDPSSLSDVDVVITFDFKGISSHAGHISLYHGALDWLSKVDPTGKKVSVYSLTTTNGLRRYMSIFDLPLTFLSAILNRQDSADRLLFFSGPTGFRKAQLAMSVGRVGRKRWFRWCWFWLSRYVSINDLKLERPTVSNE